MPSADHQSFTIGDIAVVASPVERRTTIFSTNSTGQSDPV
jgi:hypothetical protein